MINLYQKQLKDKQARVQELTVELESLLEELPKLKTVVEALEALGEQPMSDSLAHHSEIEPTVDEPMSDSPTPPSAPTDLASAPSISEADAAILLAKAQDIRSKLTELKTK